jgi:hypothetical protein
VEREDVVNAKGKLVAWVVKVCGRVFVLPGAGRNAADHDDDGRVWERLPGAMAEPGVTREPGEWSAGWIRSAGLQNVAELVLFPDVPYAKMSREQRILCQQFAQSWGIELVPLVFVDQRTGEPTGAPRPPHGTKWRKRPPDDDEEDELWPLAA